ncbi:1,4-alpha-glucan-branching protein, partial [Candidatus Magnetoovum chiemensis]
MDINEQINAVVNSVHPDPFAVLGAHPIKKDGKDAVIIRVFLPSAKEIYVLRKDSERKIYRATKVRNEGLFETIAEKTETIFPYELKVEYNDGTTEEFFDPYSFPPVLTDFDLHLISEGTHYNKYEKMGAHLMTLKGIDGVFFAVWAPNALRVSVIGDFNRWDGRRHCMRYRPNGGVWEIFIPHVKEGDNYKFEIKGKYHGYFAEKSDPYGFYAEP